MTGPAKERKRVPAYEGTLQQPYVTIPACIAECSGIRVFGRRIKSLAFTTDVAIIRNINADAIIAVYPFTPQPAIHRAVMQAADMPVFVGVGGGVTRGLRVLNLANDAENEGAFGRGGQRPHGERGHPKAQADTGYPSGGHCGCPSARDISARLAAGADILNGIRRSGHPGYCASHSGQAPRRTHYRDWRLYG